jgi:hypothetical protein
MLLAIDPGVCTGWALYDNGRLFNCGVGEDLDLEWCREFAHSPIVECPKLRPWGEKNPNAILTLARTAGEWGGRIGGVVEYVLPNDWKGVLSKDEAGARIWAKLDDAEKGIVDHAFAAARGRNGLAPSKRHNVIDAIGIGLWKCRRFGKGVTS